MPRHVGRALSFCDFSVDREAGTLLRLGEPVAIRRKLWDALCLLIDRRGTLVSTDDLRAAIWHGVAVSEGSVTNLIYELRRALDDPALKPACIETVAGRGFRFIAAVEEAAPIHTGQTFVGRQQELQKLVDLWPQVIRAERQLVVVSGEAGIGKTQFIQRFLQSIEAQAHDTPRVLVGRCVAREGGAEAYLPVFDLLDSWNQAEKAAGSAALGELLGEHAPRWARQIAWAAAGDVASLLAATEARPERMMREISAVFEAAAAQRPLVLVFEDMHWADQATIDLLLFLAARALPSRLLLICSYRHAEAMVGDQPTLRLRRAARERLTLLDLEPLSRDEVRRGLEAYFGDSTGVVDLLLDTTMRLSGGNPLFVQALSRLLVDQQVVERHGSSWSIVAAPHPTDFGMSSEIEALVSQQLDLLSDADRQLLDAAAVAGEEFDAATVGMALGQDVESVDTELRKLTLHASLVREVSVSTWPDGTTAGRFRFRHALYRDALCRSLPSTRRARLHRQIGSALERGFAAAPQSVVAALAEHFEAGGDHLRAAEYLEQAALQMIARSAIREAGGFFRRALDHVLLLPAETKRWEREVRVRTGYGLSVGLADGMEAPAIRENYEEIGRLRHRITDPDVLFPTLRVFWVFELLRFGYPQMAALSQQLRSVADASGSLAYRSLAASMTGTTYCFLGELAQARHCFEESLGLCDDPTILPKPTAWLVDPRVETRCMLAWVLWLMGSPEASRRRLAEAQQLAADGRHESTRGLQLWFRSSLAQLDSDVRTTRAAADQLESLANETSLPAWLQIATIVRALARLTEGDPTALEHGLQTLAADEGSPTILIARAYLLGQLARAYGPRGDAAHGLALVDLALSHIRSNSARVSEADLLRVRGELLEASGEQAQANQAYVEAIDVARRQGARIFQLRAATSRLRLWAGSPPGSVRTRRLREASSAVRAVCASFDDAETCHDLRVAHALLAKCG